MSNLKTSLERIAESGVAGITLRPLDEPRAHHRTRVRSVIAVGAGICIVVAAIAAAVSVRSPVRHRPPSSGQSLPVANASYGVQSEGMSPTLAVGADSNFKRVVGLPGEVLEGRNGHVFVNDQELTEPYEPAATTGDFAPVVVPPDSYFLLGDNRPNSRDSRQFGALRRSEIIAIVLRITARAERAGRIAGTPR